MMKLFTLFSMITFIVSCHPVQYSLENQESGSLLSHSNTPDSTINVQQNKNPNTKNDSDQHESQSSSEQSEIDENSILDSEECIPDSFQAVECETDNTKKQYQVCSEDGIWENRYDCFDENIMFFGSDFEDVGRAILPAEDGGYYVAGTTRGDILLNIKSTQNAFLMKINNNGKISWVQQWDANFYDGCESITKDNANNVYVTGIRYVSDQASDLKPEAYIKKFNNNGESLWTTFWDADESNDITVDSTNNLIISGTINVSNTAERNYNVLITKVTSDGNIVWQTETGSEKKDVGESVAVDSTNNIYVSGYTYGNITDEPQSPYDCSLSDSKCVDFFILKLSPSGDVVWKKHFGSEFHDWKTDLAIDSNNDIFLTGKTRIRNDSTFELDHYFNLLKLSPNGDIYWSKQWKVSSILSSLHLTVDNNDNPIIAGTSFNLPGEEWKRDSVPHDIFIQRFKGDDGMKLAGNIFGSANPEHVNDVKFLNNKVYVVGYSVEGMEVYPTMKSDDTDIFTGVMNLEE